MKQFIKNRKGENICVVSEISNNQKGLIFLMHGLGGSKDEPLIQFLQKIFIEKNFTVIIFDTTNTFGESDGKYENATITNYYEDLEDVISWAKKQDFYEEKFILSGHSLGGICTTLYAKSYPEKIKAIIPFSPVVSGKLSLEIIPEDERNIWKEKGYRIKESSTKPGFFKKLLWSHMEDRLKYNLLEKIDKISFPVLLIVGENDDSTPVFHQEIFYKELTSQKEFHIIKNAPHSFKKESELLEINNIIKNWLLKIK